MPGNVNLFMEQISHHPPVSAYQLTGPGWELSGWSQPAVVPVVRFYGIKTVAKGARRIDFADGSSVLITTPYFAIKGRGWQPFNTGTGCVSIRLLPS